MSKSMRKPAVKKAASIANVGRAQRRRMLTPFWDVTNRASRLIVSGGDGQVTISIFPKWVRHGAPMHCVINARGIKTILKDLAGTGANAARVKCQEAPKHRYCYIGEMVDGTPLTVPFVIVEKAGKDERRLRVHLGAQQVKRLTKALEEFAA